MIPNRNKDIFIATLKKGATILEACEASQISKASLYRMFAKDPKFKEEAELATFKAKDVVKKIDEQVEKRNMEKLKGMIVKRNK